MTKHRIVGVNFDHQHMGDLLRLVIEHPDAEVVGVCHPEREKMAPVVERLGLDPALMHTDLAACMETAKPTAAVLCPAAADHGEWVGKVAPYDVDILVEKPFAASLAEADAMVAAMAAAGRKLAINWPLAWYPSHRTAKRLVDEGLIGRVRNVHFYDGNRGPVMHAMDKAEVTGDALQKAKQESWFYKKSAGGGSLLDYLGYGTTLGTWYMDGRKPIEVTAAVDAPDGLEVDEHSVTIARYDTGLSKFETRWGAFTDPWTHQPQPKCGFVLCGEAGTISSYDFEPTVRVQTADCPEGREIPVDALEAPHNDPVTYFLHCIDNGLPIEGPLSPAISRIGQQIVDTAYRSAREKRCLPLLEA